jgi:urease accessory protein UreE
MDDTPPPPSPPHAQAARSSPLPEPVVVEQLPAPPDPAALARLTCERIALTARERRYPRRRVTTDGGHVLVLALPQGRALEPGIVLHVARDWYAVLEAALEPVLAVGPLATGDRIRLAHEVGGQHSDIALDGEELLVPDDPVMMRLVCRLELPWKRARRAFMPISMGIPHAP